MAFRIAELHDLDSEKCFAVIDHCGHSFVAMIPVSRQRVIGLPDSFTAELDYDSVERSECGLKKDDTSSGIFPTDDDAVSIVDGSVSNLLPIADDNVIVDVYVMNGPEFLAVTSEELDGIVPELDSRIRVWLRGIQVHPDFT